MRKRMRAATLAHLCHVQTSGGDVVLECALSYHSFAGSVQRRPHFDEMQNALYIL
jgi:hypothetical protein